MTKQNVYIGIGSNLGNRKANIKKALGMLSEIANTSVAAVSSTIETEPLGDISQGMYLNTVAKIQTSLNAHQLYSALINIETLMGRTRNEKWEPRIIDLDLLLFGQQVINNGSLIVPHQQIHLRSFVLDGLCELDGELLHPVLNKSVNELADRLNGENFMINADVPQLISIAGVIGAGKTTLAKRLAEQFECKLLLEPYDTNPFLSDVYAGKKEVALDSEIYFLTERAKQLRPDLLEKGKIVVADYIFDKSLIYGRCWLENEELVLYEKIYKVIAASTVKPVLVIYLTDSIQVCLERIHKRARPYEQQITKKFLNSLNEKYQKLFSNWNVCPVIRTTISKINYINDKDIANLLKQIEAYVSINVRQDV